MYPFWVQIFENYQISNMVFYEKKIIFYGYLKILGPFYKTYDYNFKKINFKHKNIGSTSIPPC
jgi:hypothetical protein